MTTSTSRRCTFAPATAPSVTRLSPVIKCDYYDINKLKSKTKTNQIS